MWRMNAFERSEEFDAWLAGLKDVGPGYRAYFTRRAEVVYLLLLGGDKSTQKRDIKRAIAMVRVLDK